MQRWIQLATLVAVPGAVIVACLCLPGRPQAAAGNEFTAGDARTWRRLATGYDIVQMLEIQLDDLEDLTRAQSKFSQGRRQVETIGRVIALIGNVGTVALEDDPARRKAAALREAGLALSMAADKRDFDRARELVAMMKAYPDDTEPAASAQPADWTEIMPSATVMKQVAKIDEAAQATNKLRGSAFRKEAQKLAYHGLLLMYLALVEREHEPSEDWQQFCDKLLADARKLAISYRDNQQEQARQNYSEMKNNCDACHAVYRG